jgi:putative membrane protein
MKSLFPAISMVALLAAAPAAAADSMMKRSSDAGFIEQVAQDGKAEVDLAQLAQQKAQSSDVKALAQRLATDHTKSNQQLMQIAQKEGVQPPTSASKDGSKARSELEKLNGQAFDQAFVKEVVQDHQKDIQFFQRQQNSLQDPQLKSFAQQTLPVLQEHLQMAQQLASRIGATGNSSPKSR